MRAEATKFGPFTLNPMQSLVYKLDMKYLNHKWSKTITLLKKVSMFCMVKDSTPFLHELHANNLDSMMIQSSFETHRQIFVKGGQHYYYYYHLANITTLQCSM